MSDETPDLLAGLRNGAWLDAQEFPPLQFHLPGVIPEGSVLLVGPPKIGKSWFVLALALGVSCGGRALGLKVDARPALYLALEDGDRRMQSRCRLLLQGDPTPPQFEYLTTVDAGMILATIRQWLEHHDGERPLVILDTLGKVMPPALVGESAYQRDYRVGSALKRIADEFPGSCVLTNHHDRKAESADFVDSVSGTNGLAGAADTIVVLGRSRHENDGLLSVTGRDISEGEYAVKFDGATGSWSLDGNTLAAASVKAAATRASDGLGDRSAELVAFVAEHPKGVRAGEVQLALGIDEKTAGVYLSRAAKSGRIQRASRGLYVPVRTPIGSVGSVGLTVLEHNTTNASNTPTDGTDAP